MPLSPSGSRRLSHPQVPHTAYIIVASASVTVFTSSVSSREEM